MPIHQTPEDLARQRMVRDFLIAHGLIGQSGEVKENSALHHFDYTELGAVPLSGPKTPPVKKLVEVKAVSIRFEQPGCAGVFMPLDKMLAAILARRHAGLISWGAIWFADGGIAITDFENWDRGVGIVWVSNPAHGSEGPHMVLPWSSFRLVGNLERDDRAAA